MAINSARLPRLFALAAIALMALAAEPTFAAGDTPNGISEVIFIAQIMALMVVGRLLGEAMLRLGSRPSWGS